LSVGVVPFDLSNWARDAVQAAASGRSTRGVRQ